MFDASSETPQPATLGLGPPAIGGEWRRSMACTGGACVEVCLEPARAHLRDGKQHEFSAMDIISLDAADWSSFLQTVENSVVGRGGRVEVQLGPDGDAALATEKTVLNFDAAEWSAFRSGVRSGEFFISGDR